MDRAERIAKVVLEAVLPGASMDYRADQSQGSYDFDLRLHDGSLAALEVTTSTDQMLEESRAALDNQGRGGERISANRCQRDWWIHPVKEASINRIRAKADAYLAEVEEEGLSRFSLSIDVVNYKSVRRIWQDLKIEAGMVTAWTDGPAIRIARPGQGAMVRPGNVTRAVLREAGKDDNLRKLRTSGAVERQLFVFIGYYSYAAWKAITDGTLPVEPIPLPEGIDQVWAAADSFGGDIVVWSARNGEVWRDRGLVASEAAEPDR